MCSSSEEDMVENDGSEDVLKHSSAVMNKSPPVESG
jgi:hypothetical protein